MGFLRRLIRKTRQTTDPDIYRVKTLQEAQDRGIKSGIYGGLFDEFTKHGYSSEETCKTLVEWMQSLNIGED